MNTTETQDRIIDLETRVAFQEDALRELSDALYAQDKLIRTLKDAVISLQNNIDQGPQDTPASEPPPHY
jgi:SlyX protein